MLSSMKVHIEYSHLVGNVVKTHRHWLKVDGFLERLFRLVRLGILGISAAQVIEDSWFLRVGRFGSFQSGNSLVILFEFEIDAAKIGVGVTILLFDIKLLQILWNSFVIPFLISIGLTQIVICEQIAGIYLDCLF